MTGKQARQGSVEAGTKETAASVAHEVTLAPSLLLAGHWLPVCSCRWVGGVHEKYRAAVTEGIDHMEASHG